MEVKGIECGHIDCNLRIWNDDPERNMWLTVKMTSDGYDFEETTDYCPEHGRGLVRNTKFHGEDVNTGQERIVGDEGDGRVAGNDGVTINPELAAALANAMDDANSADLARAGVTIVTDATEVVPMGVVATPEDIATAIAITNPGAVHPSTQPIAQSPGPRRQKSQTGGTPHVTGRSKTPRTKRTPDGIIRAASTVKTTVLALVLALGAFASMGPGAK